MDEEKILQEMPPEDFEYSIASHIAYEYYDNNFDPVLTQEKLDSLIEGYTFDYDPEVSNDVGVTIRKPSGDAILAFRGTRSNVDDVYADYQIYNGSINDPNIWLNMQTRLERAKNLYSSVDNKYDKIHISGHSLGGFEGLYVARENDVPSTLFNVGISALGGLLLPPVGENIPVAYQVHNFDLISDYMNTPELEASTEIRTIKQTEDLDSIIGSHSLGNYLPKKKYIPRINFNEIIDFIPETEYLTPKIVKKITTEERVYEESQKKKYM